MKKKLFPLVCTVLAAILLFASCAKAGKSHYDYNNGVEYAPEEAGYDMMNDAGSKELNDSTDVPKTGEEDPAVSQKLIKTVNLSLETTEFDPFVSKLNAMLKTVGGYVEKSNVDTRYNSLRTAHYVLRVPQEKLDSFNEQIKGEANVLNYSENAEDVTLVYADIEGRLTALRAEQTALNAMLEKAESISDIITIQSRLTSVNGEIESYESRLRVLSSKVSYSTVNIYLNEVEKITVDEKKLTVWEEIKERFSVSAEKLKNYLRDLFVGFFGSLPTIAGVLLTLFLIFAPQAVIALIIIACVKKSKKKKAARAAANAAPQAPQQPNNQQ